MQNDQQIVTTSIEGEVSIVSVKKQARVFHHNTLDKIRAIEKENQVPAEALYESMPKGKKVAPVQTNNIIFCCKTVREVPGEDNHFLIGAEDKKVHKIKTDFANVDFYDYFGGHSMGIRSIELSKDGSTLITGCEDHSLRLWDYQTTKP